MLIKAIFSDPLLAIEEATDLANKGGVSYSLVIEGGLIAVMPESRATKSKILETIHPSTLSRRMRRKR